MSGMSTYTPGMEISGGSLGHGLPIAVGTALGLRHQGSSSRVINFMSDGELDEGSTWEAVMGAHHHSLGSLTVLVDINALQADGKTDTVLRTEPVADKWAAMRMVRPARGRQRRRCAAGTPSTPWPRITAGARPSVILCDTRVGRGVPLLEEREKAHFMRIDEHEWKTCREQLTAGIRRSKQVTTTPAKVRLKTSAMIASFADPGQKTAPAPFGHALVKAARENPAIVGLTADLGKYTDMHIFAKAFPDRFFQMGMAEQLLIGAAAGMAQTGLVPFASTYSVFAARRAYDFLCLDAAEPNLNVNIVGGLPGLTTGYGPSHQATEDMAIFRGMPNLTIVDPCDSLDIEQAVPQLAASEGPTYLRLLRGNVPTVLDEYDYSFELGKAKVLRGGADVVFVSSGLMTMRALSAAKELAKHHVDVAVVHAPTIKPFDSETVLRELDTGQAGRDAGKPLGRRGTVRDRGIGCGAVRHQQACGAHWAAGRVPARRCLAHPPRPLWAFRGPHCAEDPGRT